MPRASRARRRLPCLARFAGLLDDHLASTARASKRVSPRPAAAGRSARAGLLYPLCQGGRAGEGSLVVLYRISSPAPGRVRPGTRASLSPARRGATTRIFPPTRSSTSTTGVSQSGRQWNQRRITSGLVQASKTSPIGALKVRSIRATRPDSSVSVAPCAPRGTRQRHRTDAPSAPADFRSNRRPRRAPANAGRGGGSCRRSRG